MSIDVKNRTVVVTGANRGIGKVILETALVQGADKVYAAVRNVHSVHELVASHGSAVVPLLVDMQRTETIQAAAAKAADADIVINNAGIARMVDVLSEDAFEAYEAEHNTNVLGLLRIAQAFAPVLKSNGGGALVQLNSVASIKSFGDFATYSASKAASYSLTQALREKLANQGTTVISIHPGPIKTDMADAFGFGEIAEPPSLVAEEIFDALREDRFHVFPDSMAAQFDAAYRSFAESVIDGDLSDSA